MPVQLVLPEMRVRVSGFLGPSSSRALPLVLLLLAVAFWESLLLFFPEDVVEAASVGLLLFFPLLLLDVESCCGVDVVVGCFAD